MKEFSTPPDTSKAENLAQTARAYFDAGLCPLPRALDHDEPSYITSAGDVCSIAWGQYKALRPDWPTVEAWFARGDWDTLGMVLLPGSHAQPRKRPAAFLQILDIETAELFEAFHETVNFLGHGDIWHRLVIERTAGGGGHLGFLCTTIDTRPKIVLARHAEDKKILIELLQHQPCTVAPTCMRCKPEHTEGAVYQLMQGTWAHPMEISPEQRLLRVQTAQSFNSLPGKTVDGPRDTVGEGTRPGDHLNEQADGDWWEALLIQHGWRDVSPHHLKGQGIWYFQRPDKHGSALSATYGKTGDCFYVFSSNAQPFESDSAYTPFAAYALLEHDGNFKAAAKALAQQGYGASRAKDQDTNYTNLTNFIHTQPWPELHSAALYGLAGDIVRLIDPHTEADPVALLGQVLDAFGVAVGHKPHYYIDGTDHYMNLYIVLVGQTAKGRKGTSASYVRRLFQWQVDSSAADYTLSLHLPIAQGLSSGEGLVWQVRDPITKREPVKEKGRVVDYQDVIADEGVTDKRLLVLEAEFSRVLRVMERDSNTLSACMREAWDTGDLRILTKNSPAQATGAHIGIVGHITAEELQRCLTETEAANGFGNRFLWLCVKRSEFLPEGGNINQVDFYNASRRLREAIWFARDVDKLTRSDRARKLWCDAYPILTDDRPGLLGSITGRAEAQVLRLSCIYALMDKSSIIDLPHLEAAIALWKYAEDSAVYIFGESLGDPLADEILRMLRLVPEGLSRTDISNNFGRNRKSGEIGAALERLMRRHVARMDSVKTEDARRPTEMWYATNESLYGGTNLTNLTLTVRPFLRRFDGNGLQPRIDFRGKA